MKFLIFFTIFVTSAWAFSKCEDGWSYEADSRLCYKHLPLATSLDQAINSCKELEANVATIHSNQTNDFILELAGDAGMTSTDMGSSLILGAKKVNGEFQWLDGTSLDFKHFSQGEPNNWRSGYGDRADEDCLVMYSTKVDWGYGDGLGPPEPYLGYWNDNICDDSEYRGTVCSKKPIGVKEMDSNL